MATKKAEKTAADAAPTEELQQAANITVRSGREVFSPVSYHSMEVGPVMVTTTLGEGETMLEAQKRCQPLLEEMIQDEFMQKMENYFRRLGEVDEYMLAKGMQPRAQQQTFRESSSQPANSYSGPQGGGQGNYAPKEKPDKPVANTLGDLVSAKQLGMIRALAREAAIDSDEFCKGEYDCSTDELTKRAASWLIDRLMGKFGPLDKPVQSTEAAEFAGPQSTFTPPPATSDLNEGAQARVAASNDDDIPF
jgi:hypothetical protein